MNYKEAFEKLERKNPNKAYWIDVCRRDNLSLLDFPTWFGLIVLAAGLFIVEIVPSYIYWLLVGTGGALLVISFFFQSMINQNYLKLIKRTLNEKCKPQK